MRSPRTEGERDLINKDLAKALKDAGLVWQPKKGDWYWAFGSNSIDLITIDRDDIVPQNIIWMPSLAQLLSEIEKCYPAWELHQEAEDIYIVSLWIDQCGIHEMDGTSPEDAAAKTLLWILQQD